MFTVYLYFFFRSKDVEGFTYVLKNILDKPERLRLYDVIRFVTIF